MEKEVNKIVFLVDMETMQQAFNHLVRLPFHEVAATVEKLLELESIPVKSYTTFEVGSEEEKKEAN